jgi:hypothetical protein
MYKVHLLVYTVNKTNSNPDDSVCTLFLDFVSKNCDVTTIKIFSCRSESLYFAIVFCMASWDMVGEKHFLPPIRHKTSFVQLVVPIEKVQKETIIQR